MIKQLQTLTIAALVALGINVQAQQPVRPAAPAKKYTIIIKGGHVIDPKNGIDGIMDVAIEASPVTPLPAAASGGGAGRGGARGGRIALVAKDIDPSLATQVVNAKGLYVTPGLIDIHTHNFWGTNLQTQYSNGPSSLPPDGFTFRNGVTTIVDAGSPGWKDFATYRRQTIQRSQTRVLVWLNIVGGGMRGEGRYENDTTDMNSDSTAKTILANKDAIVGIKVAHFSLPSWLPYERAEKASALAGGVPVMVDFGGGGRTKPLSIETLFTKYFKPGDVYTHCFGQMDWREFIIDTLTGKPKPYVLEARKKGIIFDVGYGGISFSYSQAIPAIKAGFYPNSISTDLHITSMNAAMKDMLTCMSKFMVMGMPFKEVIAASTWNPAKEIRREELGNLSVGSEADIAVLGIRKGEFGLFDHTGRTLMAKEKLECELTIRNGRIVYDLNARTKPMVVSNR